MKSARSVYSTVMSRMVLVRIKPLAANDNAAALT